ncbi:hypothetical protein [Delftia sp.]|uniref:hypothetical protein n=1 Tax=Delftia sp. TaxID=1886637 RepID=UPI00259CEDFF|nr:hypothetical protein [Delftia sp.]
MWDALVEEHPQQPQFRMGRIKHIVAHGQASDALGDIRILEEQFPEDATLAYYAALAKGNDSGAPSA